jgi:hypothetical protein
MAEVVFCHPYIMGEEANAGKTILDYDVGVK